MYPRSITSVLSIDIPYFTIGQRVTFRYISIEMAVSAVAIGAVEDFLQTGLMSSISMPGYRDVIPKELTQ
jgi:hypothetical protein